MYNFGVLSFWSFNTKFKVIFKIQISGKCPLFQLESPIQNLLGILKSGQHESCRVQKVEQLSCCKFFKLLCIIKSNFGNPVLPPIQKFEFIWFELNFILFGQINQFPLRFSIGHQNKCCSLWNSEQLLFWWNFVFSSNLGRILQNYKLSG